MSTASRHYRIVVALDESEYSEIVLEHAIDQAVRHDAVDLHFVRVVDREGEIDAAGRSLAQQLLEAFETVRDVPGDRRVRLHLRAGKPVDEIVRLAADLRADLLVVGRFGTHHRHRSVAGAIIDNAPCPTLVVGLTENSVDAQECAECAAVRETSDGEIWFCDKHRGDPRLRTSSLMPWAGALTHGRLW